MWRTIYVHIRWMINSARKPDEYISTKGMSQIKVCYIKQTEISTGSTGVTPKLHLVCINYVGNHMFLKIEWLLLPSTGHVDGRTFPLAELTGRQLC